jgi:hypothetical protein
MPAEHTNQCDELQPWLAAYALGEIDHVAELLEHLAGCSECRHDLQEYRVVAGVLPYSAPESVPPPLLRELVIASIKHQTSEAAPVAMPDLKHVAAPPVPARPRRSRAFWAACAFAALAVVLLGWNISLMSQLSAQTAQVTLNRQSWQKMIVLLNDSSLHWYAVDGAAAHGHFWAAPKGQVACLVAQQLPALAEGQVYQVWLVRAGEQTSGGTFEAHNGGAWTLIQAAEPISDYAMVFVTVEPFGGSTMPNGPRVMSGALARAKAPTSFDRQELLSLLWDTRQPSE